MSNKTKFIFLVLGVFVVSLLFSFSKPGQVVAEMKPLLVEVLNLPLPVTGSVTVDNLPLDETSNSLRTIPAADNLRDGRTILTFSPGGILHLDIPEGVALTDAFIQRDITSNADPCDVLFYKRENGGLFPLLILKPSAADPFTELHFESGLRSTASGVVGFRVNANCSVFVVWTGYEY